MRIDITKPSSGVIQAPWRMIIYGPEGVGKTTFASNTPAPFFFDPSGGTDRLNVFRADRPVGGFEWADLLSVIEQIGSVQHDYKTLVIDELDRVEDMCWRHVAKANGKESINSLPHGRGYLIAIDEWKSFLRALENCQERGINILLIGHSIIKTFQNPEGEDYDRYILKMNDKAAGLLKSWSENLLFFRYEIFQAKADDKTIGVASGARLIHTEHRAAFDAKNRYNLPETLPLSYQDLWEAMKKGQNKDFLKEELDKLFPKLNENDRTKATEALARANGDTRKLNQLLNWTRAKCQ